MAPDSSSRNNDRAPAQRYTMKTSRPSLTSSHSYQSTHAHPHSRHPQSHRSHSYRTSTTSGSPRMAQSVGHPHPPPSKLSPSLNLAGGDIRSSSPNYFGFAAEHVSPNSRDANHVPHGHWSPPSSSVRSFGAAIPEQLPLDANPEFEAFRRQADANRSVPFSFDSKPGEPTARLQDDDSVGGRGHEGRHDEHAPAPPNTRRPQPTRLPTNHSDATHEPSAPRSHLTRAAESTSHRRDVDVDSLHDSAYVSSDSKRNSEVSLNPPSFSNLPRFESPAQTDSPFDLSRRSLGPKAEDRQSRLSLPMNRMDQSSTESTKPRAETLPTTLESGPGLIAPGELKDVLEASPPQDYLLLDVRVSTHYAQSRIKTALNLCIPTTLLKRATFDLQKLQKTLQTEEDQKKFAEWSSVKYLVVYDNASNEKRDATSAMNMLKKFTNDGFSGRSCILRGGFDAFSKSYPAHLDKRSAADRAGKSANGNGGAPTFAPVIGGVTLPAAAETPNPFFNNIRQNVDLADGVGQLDVTVPGPVEPSSLPPWLREAADSSDHGKKVSNKFLDIERREQSRMREAYSAFNSNLRKDPGPASVQLSGVEKGVKNRYKDILPFEHARVRLPDRSAGDCDYINASHIRATRSNKRYIASQGPLPATYEDFWSVIWDQDVRVIVMLTAESEGGQLKCHPYWQSRDFGSIQLKPLSEKKVSLDIDKPRVNNSSRFPLAVAERLSEASRRRASTANAFEHNFANSQPQQPQSEAPYVVIRKFALSHTAHPFAPMREITHLYYPSWPDFGAPAQPSHLLALIELANVMQRAALPVDANAIAASVATETSVNINWFDDPETDEQARPMLVHCSAGCGRTGTFCTIDSVIDMMKRQRVASHEVYDAEGDVSMENSPISPSSMPVPNLGKNAENNLLKIAASKGSGEHGQSYASDWVHDLETDLIAKTVEDLRRQRLSMVQSLRQFVLCYETVLEWFWRFQEKTSAIGRLRMNRGDARFSIS